MPRYPEAGPENPHWRRSRHARVERDGGGPLQRAAPRHLPDAARRLWRRLANILPLTAGDYDSLERYCILSMGWTEAVADGDVKLQLQLSRHLSQLGGELGMTPLARRRLTVRVSEMPPTPDGDEEDFLFGGDKADSD